MWKTNPMVFMKSFTFCVIASLAIVSSNCGKNDAGSPSATSSPPPTSGPPQAVPPASPAQAPATSTAPMPAEPSTDIDNPTPLPAKQIRGTGTKKNVTYYYGFNAGTGAINVTATAKNVLS